MTAGKAAMGNAELVECFSLGFIFFYFYPPL